MVHGSYLYTVIFILFILFLGGHINCFNPLASGRWGEGRRGRDCLIQRANHTGGHTDAAPLCKSAQNDTLAAPPPRASCVIATRFFLFFFFHWSPGGGRLGHWCYVILSVLLQWGEQAGCWVLMLAASDPGNGLCY